jgi:hypothetical protein
MEAALANRLRRLHGLSWREIGRRLRRDANSLKRARDRLETAIKVYQCR